MPRSQRKLISKTNWELDYLFIKIDEKNAECVICGKNKQTTKFFNIIRHYNSCHKHIYTNYTNTEKQILLDSYKAKLNNTNKNNAHSVNECSTSVSETPLLPLHPIPSTSASSTELNINNRQKLAASYAVAWEIGKKHNFSSGEFIKTCAIAMAKAFNNTAAMKQFESVPLSRQTISRRIININNYLENELRTRIEESVYFSLCLDESTDITDTSQLIIFIRTITSDFVTNEELLALHPMHRTTKGSDIYEGVIEEVKKYTTFEKCSCVVTDGAPAMVGIENGFVGLLKKNNINCATLHCIIHQVALCTKPLRLLSAMNLVVKVINLIRGGNKSLSHRKFKLFLKEANAIYKDLILHSEVRWLSAGKCLRRFFAIRKQIPDFIKTEIKKNTIEIQNALKNYEFQCELAFLTDITHHLNQLNLKLQGKNQNIANLFGHVTGFRQKLQLFISQIEKNQLFHFPCCAEIQTEYPEANFSQFYKNLSTLLDNFNNRFKDFDLLKHKIELFISPLTAKINEQHPDLQLELCDLQNDMYCSAIKEIGENFFKLLPAEKYPKLRHFALKMHSMFGSTYICESAFSFLKQTKCNSRSVLLDHNLLAQLRIKTTNMSLDISRITDSNNA